MRLRSALVGGLAVLWFAGVAQAEEKPYFIGLEATLSYSIAASEGHNLAKYLSAALNHPVQARMFKTYDELAEALEKGTVDFAWINPYAFVKAAQSANVIPVAKALRRGESYRAVFFVRAGSKVRSLTDFKGLKVAWVDPTSTAGYLYPQAMLLKQRLNPSKLFASQTFAGTHKGVCDAVLSGQVDVGATFHTGNDPHNFRPDGCVESLGFGVANKVHGIAVSDPIPSEVIAARPGLEVDLALRVGGIFASMSESEAGREILKTVFRADGFGLALDSDFESVRAAAKAVNAAQLGEDAEDWFSPAQSAKNGAGGK